MDLPLLFEQQFAWQVKFDLLWDGFFAHCMCKGNDNNPLFILTTLLSLPMSFVDLGDGLEDSEFKDFEDEFDVKS